MGVLVDLSQATSDGIDPICHALCVRGGSVEQNAADRCACLTFDFLQSSRVTGRHAAATVIDFFDVEQLSSVLSRPFVVFLDGFPNVDVRM